MHAQQHAYKTHRWTVEICLPRCTLYSYTLSLENSNRGLSNTSVNAKGRQGTHSKAKPGAGGLRLVRQLLQILIEQLQKRQIEQTDPGLLVLKYQISEP